MSHSDQNPPRTARPRGIAVTTLGLAGVGAGVLLAMSGTASAKQDYTIKQETHHTVLVKIDSGKSYIDANHRLERSDREGFTIFMAHGKARHPGPVTCKPVPGRPAPSGPTVKVLVGRDGTEVITSSAGNTGARGSYHVAKCFVYKVSKSGNTGNTGF
jgi:hypothetical protein